MSGVAYSEGKELDPGARLTSNLVPQTFGLDDCNIIDDTLVRVEIICQPKELLSEPINLTSGSTSQ